MDESAAAGGGESQDSGDAGAGAPAEGAGQAYELPAGLQAFKGQIQPEHWAELEARGREQGLNQEQFGAFVEQAFGNPSGEVAALEREFGADMAQTLKAVNVFAVELAKHHREAVGRLSSSAAGVKLLNDLRMAGAGGLDLAKHDGAVKTLRATEVGRAFLKSLQVASEGIAMPGVEAAPPRPAERQAERPAGTKTANDLEAMMRDPRYWRDKDRAFIAEVTRGFEELYPDQVQTAPIGPTSSRR